MSQILLGSYKIAFTNALDDEKRQKLEPPIASNTVFVFVLFACFSEM